MLRKLVLVLLPVVLLSTACSSGGSATKPTQQATSVRDANRDGVYDPSQPTAVSADTPEPTSAPPTIDTSNDAPTDVPADTISNSSPTGGASLFGALNPLDLLDASAGDQSSSADVDPALSQTLLGLADLPAGFTSIDDVSRSATTELGDISYLMSVFSNGDLDSGDFQTIVGSAAMTLSPEALAEFNRQGGMDALGNMSDEIQSLQDQAAQLGIIYNDVRALDASGLGDGGGGIHFVIDMSALLGAFGTPEDNPLAGGIASDMYIFMRGNHVFLLMVMWPGDASSGVDSQQLASLMDAKAAAAGF